MRRLNFLKYCLQEFSFLKPQKLNYIGNFMCYVKTKEIYKRNMRISSSSKYSLCLVSEDKRHIGTLFVEASKFDKAKVGKEFGYFSIIDNKKGEIRFSKKTNSTEAINEVVANAKKKVTQSLLALLFLVIPSIAYLFYVITSLI